MAPSSYGDIDLSIIIPVYGNEGSIRQVLDRLTYLGQQLPEPIEAVFVVDGSPDRSGELLTQLLPEQPYSWQLLWHSRNFGAFAAVRTGLAGARGRYHAVMAADLQEPAELVLEFRRILAAGQADIVVGTRVRRDDPGISQMLSRTYWRIYRRLVDKRVPAGGVDIFGCTAQVSDVLGRFSESHSSLIGLLFWVGFRTARVPYDRLERSDGGKSGWSMRRKLRYMMDSLYSFTDLPISWMKAIGVFGVLASVVIGLTTLTAWAVGLIEVRGYAPLVLLLLFLSSLLLMCLGIVGSYVWRTYENSKARPSSLVMWHQASEPRHVVRDKR